jgi:hypothetical protein
MKTRGSTLLPLCLALASLGCSRERVPLRVEPPRTGAEDLSHTLSPEVRRFYRGLEQSARGEPADLNGNGVPDLFTETLPDGTRRASMDRNENGIRELISEDLPNGDTRQQADADEDGRVDALRTYTASKPPVRVTLSDEDFDGRMEKRETITYFLPDGHAFRVVTETDEDGDGIFTVISDITRKPAFTP